MAVLGLVIQQPNDTVSEIGGALEARFKRSQFARSTAYGALTRLAKAGRVRRTYKAPRTRQAPGTGRARDPDEAWAQDRYEATPEGIEEFRSWMFELPSGTPRLRDVLYGRIELLQRLEDLPLLIDMAREEQNVSSDLYEAAGKTLRQYTAKKKDRKDYVGRARAILLYVDPLHWSHRSERYEQIADSLEGIAIEAGLIPAPPADEPDDTSEVGGG
jgi:hypothetical protein